MSRMKDTIQTKHFKSGVLNEKNNLYPSKYTIDRSNFEKKMLVDEGQPSAIQVKFMDICALHDFNDPTG
jgi:hypothetical protein